MVRGARRWIRTRPDAAGAAWAAYQLVVGTGENRLEFIARKMVQSTTKRVLRSLFGIYAVLVLAGIERPGREDLGRRLTFRVGLLAVLMLWTADSITQIRDRERIRKG